MTKLPALKSVVITSAVAYSFRFESCGWAIFTLNDATGELSVHSDWGTYGHRWHIGSMGKKSDGSLVTLTEFLAHCDGHYVTKKLRLDTRSKELDDVVDDEATLAGIREWIIEHRRAGRFDKGRARDLWELANDWHSENFNMSLCPSELAGRLDCFWEYVRHKPSCRFEFMWKELWPFFSAWLRENVEGKPADLAGQEVAGA